MVGDGAMPDGGITDVAATVSRYVNIINVIPSTLYVIFVYILIESGSWQHSPDWSRAFTSLVHIGIGGIVLLVIFGFGLGLIIHPIQFPIMQFFEGYWGTGSIAQAVRSHRIMHYQRACRALNDAKADSSEKLASLEAAGIRGTPAIRVPLLSRGHEALRVRDIFPRALDQVMPTRLGNVLRRAESQAGSQYGMDAVQVVPHLLFIAPTSHVDYVRNRHSQLDLAIRMTFISLVATVTAILFLWHGLWVLAAIIPYALAYFSYLGSVAAARNYGSAIDTLINLDRFMLYEALRLPPPATTEEERLANQKLAHLFNYDSTESINYKRPVAGKVTTAMGKEVATVLGESVETSLQRALRRPVVANVMGSMSLTLGRVSPEKSQLDVKVATGNDAWRTASLTGDTRFQLSGGEDRPSAPFEVAVNAPGLEVTPRQQEAQVPTTNASKSWTFILNGVWASDVIISVTLFSSGCYIQAIQLNSDGLERHDEG